jgi:autotransporter family porin
MVPGMVQQMGITSVATFHKRQGDQFLLNNFGKVNGAWGRAFGGSHDQQWGSTITSLDYELAPKLDGHVWGLQVGLDLLGKEHIDGSQDRYGVFYTHTGANGDVSGNILALTGAPAGRLALNGDSLGVYWTHVGVTGWYVDAIAMNTWVGGSATSDRAIGARMHGSAFAASIEGGYPVPLIGSLTIEPQGQLIWQRIGLNDTHDPFTTIDYGSFDTWTGRFGARLESNLRVNGAPLQTFFSADVWHTSARTDQVIFNDRGVATGIGGTSLELRGGASMQVTARLGVYGAVGYTTSLRGEDRESISGNLGLRARW